MTKSYEERYEQYLKDLAAFEAQYPNYCRKCGGEGYVNVVDALGPNKERVVQADFCPGCIEEGKCPLCGADIPDEQYEEDGPLTCGACGWTDATKGPRAPMHPEPY